MTDGEKPLTELDALLQKAEARTTIDDDNENGDASATTHRKTLSVDLGMSTFNQRAPLRPTKTRHRKHMSSISELIANLEPVREDFRETGRFLGQSFKRKLDAMDRGETGFFDMSLTQSLSVLPDDLNELIEDMGVETKTTEEVQASPPLFQYLALLCAVMAVSSKPTALHMLEGVAAPLKLFWRMTACYVALSPFAIHSIYKDGIPQLSLSEWVTFFVATVAYSAHGCLFVTALDYTTIGNTVIYANSQALLLIIGKAFVGERIHCLEALGVVVAFSGAILCSLDSEETKEDTEGSDLAVFGDFLALLSAVGGVIYLTFAKAVRSHTGVTLFMFSVMFLGSFLVLAYIGVTDGANLEFSMNPYIGVFGWLDVPNERLPILVYLAVVVNVIGTMGFVRAMKFFDTLIIAVATLLEPLMASLIAYAFHAGLLPGTMGWFGNFLVVLGTLGVVYPSIGKGSDSDH